jgi:hypothetical protein
MRDGGEPGARLELSIYRTTLPAVCEFNDDPLSRRPEVPHQSTPQAHAKHVR